MNKSKTFIAIPPGETIKEQLHERNINQKEFAHRMGMSEKHICKLLKGQVHLTTDVSIRLEYVLGIPASFWNNLEWIYREKLLRVKAENEMDEDKKIVKKIPYNEMVKNGWIQETKSEEERVFNLRKYFEVINLGLLNDNIISSIVCRRQSKSEKADYALLAWAQKAKLEARNFNTLKINLELLVNNISKIRSMTRLDPSVFCTELVELLANCGIALIFLPHIGGSFLHGATFYDKNKIVIGLTVRGKDADKFWFSFFHEIAHILLGHIEKTNRITDEDESEADKFARDTLIPKEKFYDFFAKHMITKESIKEFADSVDIDEGIVVGRLQKENYIQFNKFNELKTKYEIK